MCKKERLIDDYTRCTKVHLIVDESAVQFSFWRPFVQETENGPFEILRHRKDNDAVHLFMDILKNENGIVSDTSRSQYDYVYRFNQLVEKSKDSFTDAYLCRSLDELKIINIDRTLNHARYSVLFPRERVIWSIEEKESMKQYVEANYENLCLGQRYFEDDSEKKLHEIAIHKPSYRMHQYNVPFREPCVLVDIGKAYITLVNGEKTEIVHLQPLPKAWLMYFLFNRKPLLYSDVYSDMDTLNMFYDICCRSSIQKKGRPRKENSSLKPGLIIRKINAELERCCEIVNVSPIPVAIRPIGVNEKGSRQVDLPKRLCGASVYILNLY